MSVTTAGARHTLKAGIGLFMLLLAAGGAYYWRFVREIPVRVAAPEQNVEVRVFGIGTVEAQIASKVGFQVNGKVVAIKADQGDFVPAGALLAKLDDEAQRAKVRKSEAAQRQAAANLAKIQAQRERAEISYQQKRNVNARRQTLAVRGTVSQETAEDAQAAEEIALGDAKVIEADSKVAAVQQDDAASQRQLESVVLAQHELHRAVRRARDRPAQGARQHRECRRADVHADRAGFDLGEGLCGRGAGRGIERRASLRSCACAPSRIASIRPRSSASTRRTTASPRSAASMCAAGPAGRSTSCGFSASRRRSRSSRQVIPSGLFVPLDSVEAYDGRSGTVWLLQDGRLAKRRVELGERLIDGRVQITSELTGALVVDDRPDLREGRAARATGHGS